MTDDLTQEDLHQAADRVVQELLDAAGVARPPVDALDVAGRHFGMAIREDEQPPPRGRARRGAGAGVVVLSHESSEQSRQWAAAQAIGDRLKADLMRLLGLDPAQRVGLTGESFAGLIAQRLLTPTAWFAGDARACGWDVPQIGRLYATATQELVAWRLLDLPEPCIITVVESGHVQRRRSNAWPVSKTLHAVEAECQRYVHHYSRPRVASADGWTVQGWPLHRPDWKREILRSVNDAE